ncbi:hypothetical protein ACMFMF_006016 [Clarireedia jacksonii]
MHLLSSLPLLLLGSSIASAAAIPEVFPELDESHIILFGENGRVEIANKADYLSSVNIATTPPPGPNLIDTNSTNASTLSKRCKSASIIRQNPDSVFLNWDVPMSSVVKAGEASSSVAVTAGYQIGNSLSVSVSSSLTIVKDFLSSTLGISYSQTWTSTYAAAYTFPVPAGKYGVVVSNPRTTRRSGYVDTGCVGEGSSAYYQADSYESHAYGGCIGSGVLE